MNYPVFAPAISQTLKGGRRLHLNQGPIDLVIEAWGSDKDVSCAYEAARLRFDTILGELVEELPSLRQPANSLERLGGPVAKRMLTATRPFGGIFITPMAAVAGAVADEILSVMTNAANLARAYVNNGGDIAVWAGPGETLQIAMVADLQHAYEQAGMAHEARIAISHGDGVGGIATSGWPGRSFSLGIADAVCTLGANAAMADAAASLIANAVDVASGEITRKPASSLDPDSDLGERPVTVGVGKLTDQEIETALTNGAVRAKSFCNKGLIQSAAIALAGRLEIVDNNVIAPAAISQKV